MFDPRKHLDRLMSITSNLKKVTKWFHKFQFYFLNIKNLSIRNFLVFCGSNLRLPKRQLESIDFICFNF